MEKFIVDHIDWFFWVINGTLVIALFFIKRWMNSREEKEKEMLKEIVTNKNNYLDRFERITENQNEMKHSITIEIGDLSKQIAQLSFKLDDKHEPLKEKIEELLKKFD